MPTLSNIAATISPPNGSPLWNRASLRSLMVHVLRFGLVVQLSASGPVNWLSLWALVSVSTMSWCVISAIAEAAPAAGQRDHGRVSVRREQVDAEGTRGASILATRGVDPATPDFASGSQRAAPSVIVQ